MSEKLEALLQAVIDAETDTSYCNASEGLAEAAPQILALIKARTPAPEGEACPHDAYETDTADQPVRCVDCGASLASPVVPVGSGEPVARATCQDCGGHIEGWICQSCARQFREDDAGNLVFEDQPVVPVGSGESERKLVRQDYINAIKAHRVEHGSSLAVARNAVDCGWRPPVSVVPVGRDDVEVVAEWLEIAKETPKPLHSSLNYVPVCASEIEAIDRILAALRPTDTGANHD